MGVRKYWTQVPILIAVVAISRLAYLSRITTVAPQSIKNTPSLPSDAQTNAAAATTADGVFIANSHEPESSTHGSDEALAGK